MLTLNFHVQTIVTERGNICREYGVGQSGRKVWEDRQWQDPVKSPESVKELVFYSKGNGKHLVSLKLGKRWAKFGGILLFVNKFY